MKKFIERLTRLQFKNWRNSKENWKFPIVTFKKSEKLRKDCCWCCKNLKLKFITQITNASVLVYFSIQINFYWSYFRNILKKTHNSLIIIIIIINLRARKTLELNFHFDSFVHPTSIELVDIHLKHFECVCDKLTRMPNRVSPCRKMFCILDA